MNSKEWDVIFIGGGAASFFSAIRFAGLVPQARVVIVERGKEFLQKVKISGGGRCNVTNIIQEPRLLAAHYPRGSRALIGPFHTFNSLDTVQWFEKRHVKIKAEEDGRMFPTTNSSATIVDCLVKETKHLGIEIITRENIQSISRLPSGGWKLAGNNTTYESRFIFIGSGSNSRVWDLLKELGLDIIPAVPSLFTFNIKDEMLASLPGISMPAARVSIPKLKLEATGPLLITHWGLSGPAVLRLSAWGARALFDVNYEFEIQVEWMPDMDISSMITNAREVDGKKKVMAYSIPQMPNRLWKGLVSRSSINEEKRWADLNKTEIRQFQDQLTACSFSVKGKSTFKEEFVTAGGVSLKEIDFKHFRAKKMPDLYLAGEVIDIDGITGGFNFQAAWTGGWIAGTSMAASFVDGI